MFVFHLPRWCIHSSINVSAAGGRCGCLRSWLVQVSGVVHGMTDGPEDWEVDIAVQHSSIFHSSFPWPRALHLECDRPLHNNLKDARSTMLIQPNEFSMQSTMLAHPLVLCLCGPLWVFGCLNYSNYGVCDVCVFVVPCECLVVFVSNIT